MKTNLIITVSIFMAIVFSSNAFSSNKFDDIYGSKVDQMTSFYQARLHLVDSEYKILSDIGKDAQKMLGYLMKNKVQLINEMKEKQLYNSAKIKSYIVKNARMYVQHMNRTSMEFEYSEFYSNKVDHLISFYQARLHLIDSEYKILSDAANDAQKMIGYLQKNKEQLINEMKDKQLYRTAKIRRYLVNNARMYVLHMERANMGFDYSKFYRSKINKMTAFYQTRLHLIESDYKILSDIGKEAHMMVSFFQKNKEQLVNEMKEKQLFRRAKIKSYIVNKARVYAMNMERSKLKLDYTKI